LTGDINIVADQEVKKFFLKGPKYRPPSKINWKACYNIISDSINNYCVKWIKRESADKHALNKFKKKVLEIVKKRIDYHQLHHIETSTTLSVPRIKTKLDLLGKKFVFVPADKAANNVVVVCKKYYIEVLRNELANSSTFVETESDVRDIIDDHLLHTEMLEAKSQDCNVPTMYWLPKLHKNPYKFRFISASSKCTTTKLSVALSGALTCIKELVVNACNKTYENSGINCFWSVKNSLEVLDRLRTIDRNITSVDSYDFSTLYTTLPHDLIKEKLGALIKWSFETSGLNFICSSPYKSFFSHTKYKNYSCWTKDDMIRALHFLLDNIFVRFGNTVYRQVIGIPMGTNCAPLIADLFLYCYEQSFMKKLQKGKIQNHDQLIEIFNNNSRYLDDILTVDNPEFLTYAKDIYPIELTLNKANDNSDCCPFLDLTINIDNGKVSTKIYDKRDDFNFPIANFPFLDGDVPTAPSYGVYISQLVRFARVCTKEEDFNERNLAITKKLLLQGYRFNKLLNAFKKFYNSYQHLLIKYPSSRKSLIKNGISHPCFYRNITNKCKRLANNPHKLGNTLRSFHSKGYKYAIICNSVKMALSSNDLKILNFYWPLTNTADVN